MKTAKHYLLVAAALLTLISFSSCENDEEIGADLSGLYGVTWYGDMGASDHRGYPLDSYITFVSGSYPDHGVGTEKVYYADYPHEYYATYKFDWTIEYGTLYIAYDTGERIAIEYPRVKGRFFYGNIDGFDFRLEYDSGRNARKQ